MRHRDPRRLVTSQLLANMADHPQGHDNIGQGACQVCALRDEKTGDGMAHSTGRRCSMFTGRQGHGATIQQGHGDTIPEYFDTFAWVPEPRSPAYFPGRIPPPVVPGPAALLPVVPARRLCSAPPHTRRLHRRSVPRPRPLHNPRLKETRCARLGRPGPPAPPPFCFRLYRGPLPPVTLRHARKGVAPAARLW